MPMSQSNGIMGGGCNGHFGVEAGHPSSKAQDHEPAPTWPDVLMLYLASHKEDEGNKVDGRAARAAAETPGWLGGLHLDVGPPFLRYWCSWQLVRCTVQRFLFLF